MIASQAGAQAAARTPALHAGPKISLGSTANVTANAFTQAPDGSVYFSSGSSVAVVKGNSKPKTVLQAGKAVLALAANTADLFVQTGLTVTEYSRTGSRLVRQWTLPKQPAPITSAGLISVGSTLWSWTNTETDGSGLEFAWISRIATTGSSSVQLITKWASSPFMTAGSTGLYFEGTNASQSHYFLGHVSPSGSLKQVKQSSLRYSPFAMALSGGKVVVLEVYPHPRLDAFNSSTLALVSSEPVSSSDYQIAGTGTGLVVLGQVCHGSKCATPTVSSLNASTGKASGAAKVPGAFSLLTGPGAVVIEVSHYVKGTMSLQRISS